MWTLPSSTLQLCSEFAAQVIETTAGNYKRRLQFNKDKLLRDAMMGALAEWAVFYELATRKIPATAPDMKIYTGRSKSFLPDLTLLLGGSVHVKSCTAAQWSWTIQNGERSGQKDRQLLAKHPNEYVALTVVRFDDKGVPSIAIAGTPSTALLGDKLKLREPRNPDLAGEKVCVYNVDLQRLSYEEKFPLFKTGVHLEQRVPSTDLG